MALQQTAWLCGIQRKKKERALKHKSVLRIVVPKVKKKAAVVVNDCNKYTVDDLLRFCSHHFGYEYRQSRCIFQERCLNGQNTLAQEGICCGDRIIITQLETDPLPGDITIVFMVDQFGYCVKQFGIVKFGKLFLANAAGALTIERNSVALENEHLPEGINFIVETRGSDSKLLQKKGFNLLRNSAICGNGTDRLVSVQVCLNRKPEFLKRSKNILKRKQAQAVAEPKLYRTTVSRDDNNAVLSNCNLEGSDSECPVYDTFKPSDKEDSDDRTTISIQPKELRRRKFAHNIEELKLSQDTFSHTENDFNNASHTGSESKTHENVIRNDEEDTLLKLFDSSVSYGVIVDGQSVIESALNNLNSCKGMTDSFFSKNIAVEEKSLCESLRQGKQDEYETDNFSSFVKCPNATNGNGSLDGQVQLYNPKTLEITDGVDESDSINPDGYFRGLREPLWRERRLAEFPPKQLPECRKFQSATTTNDNWTMALKSANKTAASRLLKRGVLPTPDELAWAYKTFGRKTEIFSDMCRDVCTHLAKKSSDIVNVWAAYREGKDGEADLVFVVCTRNKSIEVDFGGFSVYQRAISEYSTESREVLAEEMKTKFDKTLLNKLRLCIQAHGQELMENHCNISMISPSIFKSKGFGKVGHELMETNQPCIVLYVHIKGYIPIKEESFPTVIDGFPIDVREAGFTPFIGGPNEFHEHLKMGCAVHANVTNSEGHIMGGTLGAFINHPEYGKCCITCAHVVSKPEDMKNLRDNNGGKVFIGADCNYLVYQPVSPGSRDFGRLVCIVYREGGDGKSGIDAALIQITERFPQAGDFPDSENYMEAGFDQGRPMVFNSGITRSLSDDDISTEVVKFGAITGVTRGVVRMNGSIIRRTNMCGYSEFGYLLHNQVEILSVGSKPFAEIGDSGALVFAKDRNKELVAVGMVEGGMSDGRIMITPICEILSELIPPPVLQTMSYTSEECPPFYLKLQPSTDSFDDSGVVMAVDVSNENLIPKQHTEPSELASAVQALQTDMGQMKSEMSSLQNNTIGMFNILTQKLDLLLQSK